MKFGVLGTGMVGKTIGSKLAALGHEVKMGARSATSEKAGAWVKECGARASQGTFADAGAFGEMIFNCTSGAGAVAAVVAAGAENLAGKVVVDVTNPLDFSHGAPPRITFAGEDSLAEQIQRAVPRAFVVKSLNTVNCTVMVDPSRVPGDHDIFVSGNDAGAKERVAHLLRTGFGWKSVVDLGDLTTARGAEAYILFWVRVWGVTKTGDFNIKIVR